MERRELLQWMVATGGMAAFNRLSVSDLTTLGHDVHRRASTCTGSVTGTGTGTALVDAAGASRA